MAKRESQQPQEEPKKSRFANQATNAKIEDTLASRIRSSHGLPHESNITPSKPPIEDATSILRERLRDSKNP